jgi:hypothetical protein
MTGVRAVGRLGWAAIGAGLVLAGCGSSAAVTAQLSHTASPPPAKGSAPNATAVQPNSGTQHCTQVYCVPRAVRRGPAKSSAPHVPAAQPNSGGQRCTQVYCLPQAVPRGPTKGTAPNASAVQPNSGTQRCTQVYCVPHGAHATANG